jgi:hypothetical protein
VLAADVSVATDVLELDESPHAVNIVTDKAAAMPRDKIFLNFEVNFFIVLFLLILYFYIYTNAFALISLYYFIIFIL